MHDSLHTPAVSVNKFWKALDLKDVELRELEHTLRVILKYRINVYMDMIFIYLEPHGTFDHL